MRVLQAISIGGSSLKDLKADEPFGGQQRRWKWEAARWKAGGPGEQTLRKSLEWKKCELWLDCHWCLGDIFAEWIALEEKSLFLEKESGIQKTLKVKIYIKSLRAPWIEWHDANVFYFIVKFCLNSSITNWERYISFRGTMQWFNNSIYISQCSSG